MNKTPPDAAKVMPTSPWSPCPDNDDFARDRDWRCAGYLDVGILVFNRYFVNAEGHF